LETLKLDFKQLQIVYISSNGNICYDEDLFFCLKFNAVISSLVTISLANVAVLEYTSGAN